MMMEELDPNRIRWYEEYLSALKYSLPDLDFGNVPFEFSTLACIAESLMYRLEFVIDFLESSTTRHSEDKYQNETIKQAQELSRWDWLSIQSFVSSTIFAFKCTINELILPKHEKIFQNGFDIKLMEICSHFLLYSCKSLEVFNVNYITTNLPQNYIDDKGEKTAKLLAGIFIGPQFLLSYSFSNTLSSLLKCLKKNVLIMVFIKELLTNKATSPTTLAILLYRFSEIETLKTFGQSLVEDNVLSSLLANSLQSLFYMELNRINVTHKRSLEDIIRNCTKLIPPANNPFGLLCVLQSIFSMLTNKSMNPVISYLHHTIPFILDAFEVWLLIPVEKRTWCMLLKTITTVFNAILNGLKQSIECPKQTNSIRSSLSEILLSKVKIFITALIYSLKETVELSVLGLRCFENVAAAVEFSSINSWDFDKDLLNALQDALRNPAKNEEILRNPIIEFIKFQNPVCKSSDSIIKAENVQYSTEEVINLVITILGRMGGFNRNNFKETPKLHQADDMDECLAIKFYDNSSYVRLSIRKIMEEALENLLNPRCDIKVKKDSYILAKQFLECHIESLKKKLPSKFMFGSTYGLADVYKTAFTAIFVAENIPYFSRESFRKEVIEQLIVNERDLELELLIDAAIYTICLPTKNFCLVKITPLENILNMAVENFGNDPVSFPFFKYLSEQVTNLCYESTWEAKVAGCKAIELLLGNFQDWIFGNLNDFILEPLIYCIADIKEQISFGSHNIEKLGREVIFKCFDELNANEKAWNQLRSHVLKTLIQKTVSSNLFIREQVQYIWQHPIFEKNLGKITPPAEIFSDEISLLYLHEDFNFLKNIFQKSLAPLFTDDEEKQLYYKVCKSFCNFEVRANYSSQDGLRPVNLCCDALHALLFNFVSSENIYVLFQLFVSAFHSSDDDISKAGERCLKHISEEENFMQLVPQEMINMWFSKALSESEFKTLTVLQKYFSPLLHSQFIIEGRQYLIESFTGWKEQMFYKTNESGRKSLAVKLKEGYQIITLLELVSSTAPCEYTDNVITLVFELQKYMKQVLLGPLRDPILSFSKKFPSQTLNYIIKSEANGSELYSLFIEELVKTEDIYSTFRPSLEEDTIINMFKKFEDNYKYVLKIMYNITIYNAEWFKNKHTLADFFVTKYIKLGDSSSKSKYHSFTEIVIAKCLLCYYKYHKDKVVILFILMKIFNFQFQFLFIPLFDDFFKNPNGWNHFNQNFAKEYYHNLDKLESQKTSHSEKVHLAFLKLTIIMTVNLDPEHHLGEFKKKLKQFVNSMWQENKYSSLRGFLLHLLNLKEECRSDRREEDLKAVLSELLNVYTEEKLLVQCVFLNVVSRHHHHLYNCMKDIFTNEKYKASIISIVGTNPKEYYCVSHFLLTPLMKALDQELTLLKPIGTKTIEKLVKQEARATSLEVSALFLESAEFLKCRKAAYDMINIIFQWTNDDRELINAEIVNTIVNALFQIIFLVNFNSFEESQQSLSKNSLLILEDIVVKKLFTLNCLQFNDWLHVFFLLISEASAKPEIELMVMDTLKLMIKIVSDMPWKPVESFTKHMEMHFQRLSKLNLLEVLCHVLPMLLKKIKVEELPFKFGTLHHQIESVFCSKRNLCDLNLTFKYRAILLFEYLPIIKSDVEVISQFSKDLEIVCKTYVEHQKKEDEISVKVGLEVIKKMMEFKMENFYLSSLRLPALIEKLQNPELMLLIVDILNLYITWSAEKYTPPCTDFKKHLDRQCVLCEKITSRIERDFSDHKKLSHNFFYVILEKLGQKYWFYDDIGSKVMLLFCKAGLLPECQNMFCNIIALYKCNMIDSFIYLCDVFLEVPDSHFSVKMLFNLTLMTIETCMINNLSDTSVKNKLFLGSLMGLCNASDSLTGYLWMNLFPSIWRILEDSEREDKREKLQKIVQRLSKEEYSPIPNLHDVFIKATLKCDLNFIHDIDSKYIHRSYDFQLFFSVLLEKPLSLHWSSPCEIDEYIDVLNQIYSHLDGETFYSFNQVYGNHKPETLQALSYFQDDQFFEAYKLYECIKEDYPVQDYAEKFFCESQMKKCVFELERWRFCSSEPSLHLNLKDVQVLSKWIYEKNNDEQSNSKESLTLRCFICDHDIKKTAFQHSEKNIRGLLNLCSKVWQSLPPILLSHQQYSLLTLIQQLTELLEAWNIATMTENRTVRNPCKEMNVPPIAWGQRSNPFKEVNVPSTAWGQRSNPFKELNATLTAWGQRPNSCKEVNATSNAWGQRPYLLSDDFYYLTEIFHVRQVAFRDLNRCNRSNSFINATAIHRINDFDIDLCSVAFLFRNKFLRNLSFNTYSPQNMFKWNQLQLMYLLEEAKCVVLHESASSGAKPKHRDCFMKTMNVVNPNQTKYMHSDDKQALRCLQLQILKELKLEECCTSYTFRNPDCSAAWDILSEFYLNMYYESSDITRAKMSMHCLIEACRCGSDTTSLKLVTKIIYLLELENKNFSIASELIKFHCSIPRTYWIPFLPILISFHKGSENLLTKTIACILIHVGKDYPQQVFLALQCLSNTDSRMKAQGLQLYSKNIQNALRQEHPNLINMLQKIVETFQHFGSNLKRFWLNKFKEKLENTYTLLFQHLKSKQNDLEKIKKSILGYLDMAFKSNRLLSNLNFKDDCCKEICFQSLKDHTPEDVIVLLQGYINSLSTDQTEFSSQDVHEKMKLLSSLYLHSSMSINLFGQNPLIDPSHQIEVYKFLPKVDVVKWKDDFTWKIYLKGNNGKQYSFLLLEDFCRDQTLNTKKLVSFWEFLNPLIEKHVHSERRFLKALFPRAVPISSCKLVSHDDGLTLYQDIYKEMNERSHSAAERFLQQLYKQVFQNNESPELKQQFQLIQKEVHEDVFSNYIEKIYPNSTLDSYCFKKQFVKHLSILVSAEIFFKMSCRKDLCIMKTTGAVSTLHMELNFENNEFSTDLLTPNIAFFLGPVRIKELIEYVVCISSCVKLNQDIISKLLQISKKEYSIQKHKKMRDTLLPSLFNRLQSLNRTNVEKLLQSCSELTHLSNVNPVMNPWF